MSSQEPALGAGLGFPGFRLLVGWPLALAAGLDCHGFRLLAGWPLGLAAGLGFRTDPNPNPTPSPLFFCGFGLALTAGLW